MNIKTKVWDSSLLTLTDSSGKMNLFELAIPMFFQQIFTLLLGTVNTVVLAKVSSDAVTAVNVANSVLNIPNILLMMPSNGTIIVFSIILGMGKKEMSDDTYKTGLIINMAVSFLLSGVLLCFAPRLLKLMNISGTVLENAIIYFRIRSAFLIMQAMITYFTGILRAYGNAKPTMVSGLIVNGVNALLSVMVVSDIIFPGSKIVGVSVGAIAGQLAGAIYSFCIFIKDRPISGNGKYKNSTAIRIMKIGIPSGLSLLAYNISTMIVTALIARLGSKSMNTQVFVSNITGYTHLFGYATALAGSLMIGRLCGAGKFDKAKRLFGQNMRFVPMINTVLAAITFLLSDKLMGIFTSDKSIVQAAHYLFLANIAVECFRGITHVGENALCGIEDTVFTSIVSIAACFGISVLFCWIFIIHLRMGLMGYYLAAMMDEGIRGLLYRIRWSSGVGFRRFRGIKQVVS